MTSLLRLSEPLAVGLLVEYGRLEWTEAALGGPPDASVDRLLLGGALRWYPLRDSLVLPYAQLAAGHTFHSALPESGGCRVDPSLGAQLTAGGEVEVASWARVGGSVTASAAVYTQSCLEEGGERSTLVDPGLGLSTQVTFTTVWSSSSGS